MFPRYFVPRKAEPDPAPTARGPLLLHVVDVFRLGGRGRSQREVAVVVDRAGALHLLDPADLPPAMLAELHHHELANRGEVRMLDVEDLWLLSIQLLEQPGDAPGLNDPVYLYGRLYGPLPSPSPVMADGQLALTRADLLDGFVRAAPDAFHIGTVPPTRCLHAVLPADRAEVVEQGRGLVLAYPLLPAELLPSDAGNELLVAGLVHDLLVATQADAKQNRVDHPLLHTTIPVPSREDLERDLDAQGWDVKGDRAVRRSEVTRSGIGSVFAQVFGVPDAMKLDLPPEGSADELLALADRVLPAFQGFPDRRTTALRARTVRRGARTPNAPQDTPTATPFPPREPRTPRPSSQTPAPSEPSPSGRHPVARLPDPPPVRRSDESWMSDFVQSHGSRPRITRVADRPAKPAPRGGPDWMKDFEDG